MNSDTYNTFNTNKPHNLSNDYIINNQLINNNKQYQTNENRNFINNDTNSNYQQGYSQHYQPIQTSVFRAIYDYDAKEDDEISFRDGDRFTNCEHIDVGWMIGMYLKDKFKFLDVLLNFN
jgi:hypothetical protein